MDLKIKKISSFCIVVVFWASLLFSAVAKSSTIATSSSVTVSSVANPSTLLSSQFNKYDNSTYIQTSDGTANGEPLAVWHYSIAAQKWVKSASSTAWGGITGTLANQTDLQNNLNLKANAASISSVGFSGSYSDLTNKPTALTIGAEPLIASGTSSQYLRGDKTFQTLNTSAVVESSNLYYSDLRSRSAISATGTGLSYNSSTGILNSTIPYMNVFTLTSNVSSTTVTRALIPTWTIPVTTGKKYRIEIEGTYQTAALTTGGTMGFVLNGGAVGSIAGRLQGKITNTAANTLVVQSIFEVNSTAGTTGSTLTTTAVGATNTPHYIGGVVVFTCTTSGNLQVMWASEVEASAAQLNRTSMMFVTEY